MAGFGAPINGGVVDIVFDGEVPRSFSGRAREVISGGQYVTISGAANVVGSTMDLFNPGSIVVSLIKDSSHAVGVALNTAGSNEVITVGTRGAYLATVAGTLVGGDGVYPVSGVIQGVAPISTNAAYSGTQVGRALTGATSGTNSYSLVNFSF